MELVNICPLFPDWVLFNFVIPALVIWDVAWKGVALWKSARNGHLAWFICILVFNTVGILPIFYIFGFSKKKASA